MYSIFANESEFFNDFLEKIIDYRKEHENVPYPDEAIYYIYKNLSERDHFLTLSKKRREIDGTPRALVEHLLNDHILHSFGPMSSYVVSIWRIENTRDIGQILKILSEMGMLSLFTKTQKVEDYQDLFDLDEILREPYI